MRAIPFYHVDVFSPEPLAGNGLIVFTEADGFGQQTMQILTQEMRQFESIFLQHGKDNKVRARIFTVEEELNFAGHPVLGAAATLHDLLKPSEPAAEWVFELNEKTVTVVSKRTGKGYDGIMNQGQAIFGHTLNERETKDILACIGATPDELYPGLFPTVVSTGLPYLIVPFKDNRFRAKVGAPGLHEKLHAMGALFIGLLDIATTSIRTGNNAGTMEDIATGSLAGPAGAFLVSRGLAQAGTKIRIGQGRNLGRNSELYVEVRPHADTQPHGSIQPHVPVQPHGGNNDQGSLSGLPADIYVSGSVCKIAQGTLDPSLSARLTATG